MRTIHYFLNYGPTLQSVMVHLASCSHCNNGAGIHAERDFNGFIDVGYLSLDEAKQKAKDFGQFIEQESRLQRSPRRGLKKGR